MVMERMKSSQTGQYPERLKFFVWMQREEEEEGQGERERRYIKRIKSRIKSLFFNKKDF